MLCYKQTLIMTLLCLHITSSAPFEIASYPTPIHTKLTVLPSHHYHTHTEIAVTCTGYTIDSHTKQVVSMTFISTNMNQLQQFYSDKTTIMIKSTLLQQVTQHYNELQTFLNKQYVLRAPTTRYILNHSPSLDALYHNNTLELTDWELMLHSSQIQ